MKVYLVEWYEFDDVDTPPCVGTVGVYSSEMLAAVAGTNFVGNSDPEYTTYTIVEMTIDA